MKYRFWFWPERPSSAKERGGAGIGLDLPVFEAESNEEAVKKSLDLVTRLYPSVTLDRERPAIFWVYPSEEPHYFDPFEQAGSKVN